MAQLKVCKAWAAAVGCRLRGVGQLLMGHGSAYEQVTGTADSPFDRWGPANSKVASWLKGQLHDAIERAGLSLRTCARKLSLQRSDL